MSLPDPAKVPELTHGAQSLPPPRLWNVPLRAPEGPAASRPADRVQGVGSEGRGRRRGLVAAHGTPGGAREAGRTCGHGPRPRRPCPRVPGTGLLAAPLCPLNRVAQDTTNSKMRKKQRRTLLGLSKMGSKKEKRPSADPLERKSWEGT